MDGRRTLTRCRRSAVAAFFLTLALTSLASAADNQIPLHVRTFTMDADKKELRVGESLHLRVDLVVDETVTSCASVMLPDFYGFDSTGDEQRTYTRPTGTDCTEIVTLSPAIAGTRIIAPAVIDGADPQTSRPMRFSTNTVTIQVLDAPIPMGTIVRNTIVQMLKAVIVLLLMTIVGLGVYWAFRRTLPGFAAVRRMTGQSSARERTIEPEEPVTPPAPPDERARWSAVAAALSTKPTRQSVIAIRTILRERVRARDDEVFGELMARVAATTDPALLDVMRTIERAAFIDDANLPSAVRDAVRALERLAEKPPMLSS